MKTLVNIFNNLNESYSDTYKVKKQVFMEGKEITIKEAEEAEILNKDNKTILTEDSNDVMSRVLSGDEVYFRDSDDLALMMHYADSYPQPEEFDEGYILGWERGEDEEYDKAQDERYAKAKQAAEEGNVFELLVIDEETLQPKEVYGYLYGEEELFDILNNSVNSLREVKVRKSLEESEDVKAIMNMSDEELEDYDKTHSYKNADLADYVRNKTLYRQSGLDRHRKAMEKAKKALGESEEENVKDIIDNQVEKDTEITKETIVGLLDAGAIDDYEYYSSLSPEEKDKLANWWLEHYNDDLKEAAPAEVNKEERLASLKVQIAKDGEQLAADEREAIEKEIADLEAELFPIDETEEARAKVEESVEEEIEAAKADSIEKGLYNESVNITTDTVVDAFKNYLKSVNMSEEEILGDYDLMNDFINEFFSDMTFDVEDENDVDRINEIEYALRAHYNMNESTTNKGLYDEVYSITDKEELKEIALNAIYVANKDTEIIKEFNDRNDEKLPEDTALYDYVANHYTEMDIEKLREIALNAVYVANDDEAIKAEIADRKINEDVTDNLEGIEKIHETAVANLKVVKSQGNIYMLESAGKIIVGEDYNEAEKLIENAEIYTSDEDANKDYNTRCGITLEESFEEKDLSKDLLGSEAEKRQNEADRALEKYLNLAREIKAGNNDTITLDSAKELLKNAYIKAKCYYSFEPEEIDRRIAKDIPDLFGDLEEGVISDLKATHLAKKAAKLNKEKDFDKSTKAFAKSMEINDKSADKIEAKAKKLEDKAGKLRNEAIVKRHKTVKDFIDKK